ncbi:myo-inositol-1-phosphate synthase [Catenulispora sp. GAS73]|uniref:inositol-3-phosphate synthase n=1 Tax=Catenulispora sp. GAS73 TaxID=3156269 RepID=UPI00351770D7
MTFSDADEIPAAIGVWLVGARGSVAVTAIAGAAAPRAGLLEPIGCVTAAPEFAAAGLPDYADLVFGGHDISGVSVLKQAEELVADGVLPAGIPEAVADGLRAADAAIRSVPLPADDVRPVRERIRGLIADIEEFRDARRMRRIVVVNVASTEPPSPEQPWHHSLAELEAALDRDVAELAPSTQYAYAAMRAGCSYVDFTPSTGARPPALDELARSVGVPYAGSDAKTGETLLVSALAPMFTARALRVRSWSGTNLLGGGDGATLADAGAAASKTVSKRRGLDRLLGAPVEGRTHIDNVPTQGGWKTAWDHIGFEGFGGVRMTMQLTWQGCDSALAAPLVLDLARLLARAHDSGAVGAFAPAAFFFKDPVPAGPGEDVEYRLASQYDALLAWAASVAGC